MEQGGGDGSGAEDATDPPFRPPEPHSAAIPPPLSLHPLSQRRHEDNHQIQNHHQRLQNEQGQQEHHELGDEPGHGRSGGPVSISGRGVEGRTQAVVAPTSVSGDLRVLGV